MSKCKHTRTFTAGQYGEPRVRKCNACWTVIPWGPAVLTPQVEWEMLAAETAYGANDKSYWDWASTQYGAEYSLTDRAVMSLFSAAKGVSHDPLLGSFRRGWIGGPGLDCEDSYACGALARAIYDHEDEPCGTGGRVFQCCICGQLIPLGPATMSPQAEYEVLAAEVARDRIDSIEPIGHGYSTVTWRHGTVPGASFSAGWSGEAPPLWSDGFYQAGVLARAIYDHELKEER